MNYTRIVFKQVTEEQSGILTALLSEIGYEGFEELGDMLVAYIPIAHYDEDAVKDIADTMAIDFETDTIEQQNWNEAWEKSFEPVVVDDFCTIRADFHEAKNNTRYDIVVTPRMSFGTGHHATTQMMIESMREMDFKNKRILDFGTGTGVLAILAEKLGASDIVAIDNDEWSYLNAIDNCEQNNCKHIHVQQGSLENASAHDIDVLLANINRHILLEYMHDMYNQLTQGGYLLLSGILKEDEPIINNSATATGLVFVAKREKNNWLAMLYQKG